MTIIFEKKKKNKEKLIWPFLKVLLTSPTKIVLIIIYM